MRRQGKAEKLRDGCLQVMLAAGWRRFCDAR
jgi:hypothetical protein